jgi:hypothetical protein
MHKPTIQERFDIFHATNPHVYRMLLEKAEQIRQRGWTKASIQMLIEVLRWSRMMTDRPENEEFKIPNEFAACYSRLLIRLNPELDGFFELRRRTAV